MNLSPTTFLSHTTPLCRPRRCSLVWKPASTTPLTAIAVTKIVAQVCADNDVDPAVFTLCVGRGSVVGERMLHDRRMPLISCTGSCEVASLRCLWGVVGTGRESIRLLKGAAAFWSDRCSDIDRR